MEHYENYPVLVAHPMSTSRCNAGIGAGLSDPDLGRYASGQLPAPALRQTCRTARCSIRASSYRENYLRVRDH